MHSCYSTSAIFALLLEMEVQGYCSLPMNNTGDDLKTGGKALTNVEITSSSASSISSTVAGISLRSYKSYENESRKKGTPIFRSRHPSGMRVPLRGS